MDSANPENLPAVPAALALGAAEQRVRDYVSQAKAPNTLRAYAADWRHFTGWCQERGREALPAAPVTVSLYLAELAAVARVSTLTRRVSALSQAHQLAGFEPPTGDAMVRTVMAGIRRAKGTAQVGKRPVVTADLRRMLERLPDSLQGVRDRALLLVGFAGAFRRSELVGLDLADLEFGHDGLVVTVRRSKTDPEGKGRRVGIPYGSHPETCPVRAAQGWVNLLAAPAGPLFRRIDRHGHTGVGRLSDKAVALIIKRAAAAAGLAAADLAGHSLRAGLATAAAAAGVSERAIMAQTGHRSVITLRKYIREGSLFLENAAAKVGL
jgi:site-specific recombinase XerD